MQSKTFGLFLYIRAIRPHVNRFKYIIFKLIQSIYLYFNTFEIYFQEYALYPRPEGRGFTAGSIKDLKFIIDALENKVCDFFLEQIRDYHNISLEIKNNILYDDGKKTKNDLNIYSYYFSAKIIDIITSFYSKLENDSFYFKDIEGINNYAKQ